MISTEFVFHQEDDRLQFRFAVTAERIPALAGTRDEPGSRESFEDVCFKLVAVRGYDNPARPGLWIKRECVKPESIVIWEREMSNRYVDIPSVAERVDRRLLRELE